MLIKPAMLATAMLLGASVMTPVFAANNTPVVVTPAVQVAQSLAVAETPGERRPIIEAALGSNPGAAVAIVDQLKLICVEGNDTCTPTKAAVILQEILAYLGLKKENEAIIQELLAKNEDLLALAGSDIEPAAGPDDGSNNPEDLGNTTSPDSGGPGEVVENPNQVSGNQVQ